MGFKQKYSLDPKEQRRARVKMQITISEIIWTSLPKDRVVKMEPFDIHQYDFYAGPEENEPLESDGS